MLDKRTRTALTTPVTILALAMWTGCFSPSTESANDGDESETEDGPESGGPGADDRGMGGSDDNGGGTGNEGSSGDGKSVAGLDADCGPGLFGDVLVGQAKVAEIVLTNESQVPTAPIETSLASPDSFEIAGDDCDGVSLEPGQTCTVRVRYEPSEVGEQVSNNLRFAAGESNASCSLNGDGIVRVNVTRTCGVGTITSDPVGLECGASCSAPFRTPNISLLPTPDSGARFVGWTGACEGPGECDLVVDNGEVSADAQFLSVSQPAMLASGSISNSVTLDPSGGLHVAIATYTSIDYLYRNPDGLWEEEVSVPLDRSELLVGELSMLRIDTVGALHLVHRLHRNPTEDRNNEVRYLRRSPGGDWDAPITLDTDGIYWGIALMIDSTDDAHIVYTSEGTDEILRLKHVVRSAQGDFSAAQDVPLRGVRNPSLALGSDDRIHMAYTDVEQDTLYHIERAPNGVWGQPEVVASDIYGNGVHSLVSDSNDRLHLLYSGSVSEFVDGDFNYTTESDIRYIRRERGGSWTSPEVVDAPGSTNSPGAKSSVIDEKGRVHVVYYTRSTDDLKYAVRNELGHWGAPQALVTEGDVGRGPSMVIDSEGRHHVFYTDRPNFDAWYLQLNCP